LCTVGGHLVRALKKPTGSSSGAGWLPDILVAQYRLRQGPDQIWQTLGRTDASPAIPQAWGISARMNETRFTEFGRLRLYLDLPPWPEAADDIFLVLCDAQKRQAASGGGAPRPENRVWLRSNEPQKNCIGLLFPTNVDRNIAAVLSLSGFGCATSD